MRRKSKKQERLERVTELRAFALKLLGENGQWMMLPPDGLEVLCFEDAKLQIGLYARQQVPKAFRERFHPGPLAWGFCNLDTYGICGLTPFGIPSVS